MMRKITNFTNQNFRESIGALSALVLCLLLTVSCKMYKDNSKEKKEMTAENILGNPDYQAISFGGYRHADHSIEPTVKELKEDMRLLHAMGIKLLRTYKVHLPHASNVLEAIHQLKQEDPDFEMYVMLGAWINCQNAFSDDPTIINHDAEDAIANQKEIDETVRLAKKYPDIVKIIAVGNEAMVKWAASYFVQPGVILKYVNQLQDLKKKGDLPKSLWITSSDNFASWGGGGDEYHVEDLEKLIKAVDFLSVHTYPMHDTHYNSDFWKTPKNESHLEGKELMDAAMVRAKKYAQKQFQWVQDYMKSIGVDKPMHIGETGWASSSDGYYGPEGSRACDEYKEALYYQHMRDWTNKEGISCFYFEAFDEHWKDAGNPAGSENHFGLFTIDGQAKYAIWDWVDKGVFEGLGRNGKPVTKTHGGDEKKIMEEAMVPQVVEMAH